MNKIESLLPKLTCRNRRPEVMDQPGLAPDSHVKALVGLSRINWVSGSDRAIWQVIRKHCLRRRVLGDDRAVKVLDLAAGGGDTLVRLWKRAHQGGWPVELSGCDVSPFAVEYGFKYARSSGTRVTFFEQDVIHDPLPRGYDILISSLFLHHLDEIDGLRFLQKMAEAAGEVMIVNDLIRSRFGWWLAKAGVHFLTRSSVVHVDAPISVEGAFTVEEATHLAKRAGWENLEISTHWPCRFQICGSRV